MPTTSTRDHVKLLVEKYNELKDIMQDIRISDIKNSRDPVSEASKETGVLVSAMLRLTNAMLNAAKHPAFFGGQPKYRMILEAQEILTRARVKRNKLMEIWNKPNVKKEWQSYW